MFTQLWRYERIAQARNAASFVLFVSACAVWLVSFCRLGVSQEGLPWYVTIGVIAAFSVRFLRAEESFCGVVGLRSSQAPLKLKESVALSFMSIAVALYSWVGYRLLHPSSDPPRVAQIVDIQLLSDKDFKDNQEQVPGTQPQADLRKRQADQISQQGDLNESRAFQSKLQSNKEKLSAEAEDRKSREINAKAMVEQEEEKPAELPCSPALLEKTQASSNVLPVIMPQSWQTKTIDPHYVPAASRSGSPGQSHTESEPYMSEVAPPELVELMENDGDSGAMHVFQKGGKSSDGKGAENGLSSFLKELHKRIKNSWAPPRGSTRTVEVLFRLKKDGRLAFLKITRSSGLADTDTSATKAIVAAASSGQALPKDYAPNYLDVIYTFKYKVDELQEINSNNDS